MEGDFKDLHDCTIKKSVDRLHPLSSCPVFHLLRANKTESKQASCFHTQPGLACTYIGVAELVLPIGPDTRDSCRPQWLREALIPSVGTYVMAAACFWAVEET